MRIRLTVFGLAVLGAASLHLGYPAVAAVGCPFCYGFSGIGDDLYVESGMPPDRREAAKAAIEAARERVRAFYGDQRPARASSYAPPLPAIVPSAAVPAASRCSTGR